MKTPGGTLKQVKDVVNKGAKAAEPMKGMKEEEQLDTEEVIEEEEVATKEVVAKEEIETVAEYDIEEDVNALLGGEDLSEGFKAKAKTIFEAAINTKVAEVKEALEAQYQEQLADRLDEAKEELKERVDSYLEYVADEWVNENELAIEQGLKTEMTESFLGGMKSLFEEHYVSIPEDKYDVLESMVEKLDDMETKLNEQIEKNIGLNKRLAESSADSILTQVSEGLATTQKENLPHFPKVLSLKVKKNIVKKLETLKESYFSSKPQSSSAKTETLSEGVDVSTESYTGSMEAYLRTLGSFSK